MRFNNYFKEKINLIAIFGLILAVSSCGSSQYASQDNDGVYGSSDSQNQVVTADVNSANQAYYKNYFKEKSQDYVIYEEDEVFTDIDSYEGNYSEEAVVQEENSNYAGWGQENDDVTINVYSGAGFGFNNFWGGGFYRPWRFGYGWGYGGFDPFWCPPFYGGFYGYSYYSPYIYNGYGYPYYNYGYNGRYYGRNGVAFNTGRRGSIYNRNANLLRSNGLNRNLIRTQRPLNSRSTLRPSSTIGRPAISRPQSTRPTTTRPATTRPSNSRGRPANTSRTKIRTNNTPSRTRVRTNTSPTRRSSSINRSTSRGSSMSTRSSSPSRSSGRSSGRSASPRGGRR